MTLVEEIAGVLNQIARDTPHGDHLGGHVCTCDYDYRLEQAIAEAVARSWKAILPREEFVRLRADYTEMALAALRVPREPELES